MNVDQGVAPDVLRASCIKPSAHTIAEPQPSKLRRQTHGSDSESLVHKI